jgi:hypothetical protein
MWYVEDQALSVACHIDILEATFTLRNIYFQTKLVEEIFFAWFFKVQLLWIFQFLLVEILEFWFVLDLSWYKSEFQYLIVEIGIPIYTGMILDPTGFQFV